MSESQNTVSTKAKIGILEKITFVLLGTLAVSMIFLLTTNALNQYGIYLGAILTVVICYYAYKYKKENLRIKLIIFGMSGTLLLSVITLVILYAQLKSAIGEF